MKFSNIFGKAVMVMAVAIFALGVNAEAKGKKIGIQLYSVMSAMNKDPKGSIDKLAEMGYNVFELVQWGGNPKVFGMEAAEFKAYCDSKGISVVSTHSSLQEDPAKEAEVMDNWRKLFAVQKAVGGKYFVIPSYRVNYTEAEVKKMADYFNRVGKIAKEEFGLMLGYHNHSQEYKNLEGTDKVMWEYLVENTNPEYVCFELDVYWCTKGDQDPVAYLKKYPEALWQEAVKRMPDELKRECLVEAGLFPIGANPFVDKLAFKCGEYSPLSDYPYVDLIGKRLKKGPADYRDVREKLEKECLNGKKMAQMEAFMQKYAVEIDKEVLKTVNRAVNK